VVFAKGGLSSLRRSSPVDLPFGACEDAPFVLLDLSCDPACQPRLQRIQFTGFISNLTNSNECGNLLVKVLLTVSPSRPFFLPQPRVSPRAPHPTHHSLSTAHYPLSCIVCHPQVPALRTSLLCVLCASVANPIFSLACRLFSVSKKVNSFAIKQIQPLFRKCRGVGVGIPIPSLDSRRESTRTLGAGDATTGHAGWGVPPAACFGVFCPAPPRPITPFRINTCKSVSKQTTLTSFRITTYEKHGGARGYC
jgi:hypothetical protein